MKSRLEHEPRIDLREAMVERLLVEDGRVVGVVETLGLAYRARAVLITTGTFLNGLIHIGEVPHPGGPGRGVRQPPAWPPTSRNWASGWGA